jgi:hypothetical protein
METSGKSLMDHWSWAAEKRMMNRNAAAGLFAACGQALGDLGELETTDGGRLESWIDCAISQRPRSDFGPITRDLGPTFRAFKGNRGV